jgi:hypothetical protein
MDKRKLWYINHAKSIEALKVAALIIGFILLMMWAGGTFPY